MAVFRVERNKGYTVMSNHHLRNKELTLKAKGLLSQMLSLPEDWDYTLAGLSQINREKIDAIREAIKELERAGYIVRSRERDEKGRLRGADYVIYEQPHTKAARSIRQRKQRNEKRTDELTRLIRKLYEDNVSGRLSDTLFEQMLRDFEAELSDLTEIISQDQQELERISRETINAEKFLSLVRKYTDFSELTPAMINEFVEKKQSYLSLGGVGEKALLRFLSDRPDIQTVYLCLDSDEAGNDACSRLAELVPEGLTVHRLVPLFKDWNEVLQHRAEITDGKYIREAIYGLKEPPQEETVEIIRMSEVDTQTVEWLWEPYIPFGKVTIVQGNPGEGKTTFALRLAAVPSNLPDRRGRAGRYRQAPLDGSRSRP